MEIVFLVPWNDALYIAMKGMGIKEGDEVITTLYLGFLHLKL